MIWRRRSFGDQLDVLRAPNFDLLEIGLVTTPAAVWLVKGMWAGVTLAPLRRAIVIARDQLRCTRIV